MHFLDLPFISIPISSLRFCQRLQERGPFLRRNGLGLVRLNRSRDLLNNLDILCGYIGSASTGPCHSRHQATNLGHELDLDIDNKTNKYTFNTEKIQLNGLKLSTKGFVQMPDTNNMVMDITFNTPSNDFKDILSLVPGIYTNDFKDIKTSGKLALSGYVKGTYNKKQMPAYGLNLGIQDGSFQYTALPEKVSDIQVKLEVANPDGITDHAVVNLSQCHLNLGGQPFDFRMLLKTPVTDQWIDASAKGSVDLAQVQKFVKLDAGTKLAGTISADVSVKGSIADAKNSSTISWMPQAR